MLPLSLKDFESYSNELSSFSIYSCKLFEIIFKKIKNLRIIIFY